MRFRTGDDAESTTEVYYRAALGQRGGELQASFVRVGSTGLHSSGTIFEKVRTNYEK